MKEKKSNITQYIPLLFVVVGLALLALSYFKGYEGFKTEKEDVQKEIDVLDKRYQTLDKLYRNKDQYLKDIEINDKEYEKILADYDADSTDESVIMDLYNAQLKNKLDIKQISLARITPVYTFGQMISKNPNNAVASGINPTFSGNRKEYSVELSGDYSDVKDFIYDLQNTTRKRRVPTSLSFSIDENGVIVLNMDVSEYAISGEGLEPLEVVIPNTEHGAENIFTTDIKVIVK